MPTRVVSTGRLRSERWRAKWIWAGPPALVTPASPEEGLLRVALDPIGFGSVCLFRRRIPLDDVPTSAPARVTGDSRYVLWVNETEVARGPVRGQPLRLHYDEIDLAEHLVIGENTLAALVHFYGDLTPWWYPAVANAMLGGGCFAFECRVGTSDWVVSDSSWAASRSDAWTRVPLTVPAPPVEVLDARRVPSRWQSASYDDSHWEPATELLVIHPGSSGRHSPPSAPYGSLLPRPIPALEGEIRTASARSLVNVTGGPKVQDPVEQLDLDEASSSRGGTVPAPMPLKIDASDGATLALVDFGEIVAGLLSLDVEAPAGACIDCSVAEEITGGGDLDRRMQRSGFRYVTRGADDRFETLDPVGLRFARLSIRSTQGPVIIRSITVRERLYPRPAGPFFECSDELLERIHRVGLRTVALNAQDAYLDCPTREQRAWTGDAIVHQMVDLATNPDWGLARWHVELTAAPRSDGMLPMAAAGDAEVAGTFIPDWPLHWIHALHNLYRYTGDRELVQRLLPTAERLLAWFAPYQGENGLLRDVTGWVLIDWASTYNTDTSCALNALWARALGQFADMAEWLDDRGRAAWAHTLRARVAAAFEVFWDDERGGYVDHLVEGQPDRPMSQHGAATALCAELVPHDRFDRVVDLLTDRSRLVRRSWMLDALFGDQDWGPVIEQMMTGPPAPDWDAEHQVMEAQPFFRHVVHEAVVRAGRPDLIPDLCRDWSGPLEHGATTWPESWVGGSHCHGWSSIPSHDLVVYTLGIEPAAPGFERVRVAPRLGSLSWARGAAPTPHGLVTVDIAADSITIDSPRPVELDLGAGSVRAELPAGTHRIDGSA